MALLASEVNGLTGLKDSREVTSSTLLVVRLGSVDFKVTDTEGIVVKTGGSKNL